MEDPTASRRKFLQQIGLSAGATLFGKSVLGAAFDQQEIRKLTPPQQTFMHRYESWMNDYIEVIRVQKKEPDNTENHKKMIALTEKAETFKPELSEFMQDPTFALIYRISIQRLSNEI